MLKVAFLHFPGDSIREQRSGWYITDECGAIVGGTPRFEHQARAARALMALINAPAFA